MKPQIKAIYLCVKDMKRAVKFYEDIFETPISLFGKRMSVFDFDNISLLLFDPSADNETISLGNNVIPNIEVQDINKMLEIIKEKNLKIIMPLEEIKNYLIFQTKDPEGNIIEFYQIKA